MILTQFDLWYLYSYTWIIVMNTIFLISVIVCGGLIIEANKEHQSIIVSIILGIIVGGLSIFVLLPTRERYLMQRWIKQHPQEIIDKTVRDKIIQQIEVLGFSNNRNI